MFLARLDPRAATAVRLIGLVLISASILSAHQHAPGTSGRALVVSLFFAACVVAWVRWIVLPLGPQGSGRLTWEIWVLAIGGAFLTEASPSSAASAFVFAAVVSAGLRVEVTRGAIVIAAGTLALSVSALIYNGGAIGVLAYALGFTAALLAANNALQAAQRAEQAELLLAQAQRSHEEQLRTTRLEESARIAREIHDVLAHALAGLTIQLEATSALLKQGAEREEIAARVERAHALAREGLLETRRAVGTLRGDRVDPALAIRALVDEYRASGAPATLEIEMNVAPGEPALRIVQEALTNVRKHAPGAEVAVRIATDSVSVENSGGGTPPTALARSGGGYGVQGMRERAEALGGSLEAGPTERGWRVVARLPGGAG